jgi:hypothetical protein
MMIGFVKDEMTSETTLVECNLVVISNVLVSCIIGPKEKFWLLITSPTSIWSSSLGVA